MAHLQPLPPSVSTARVISSAVRFYKAHTFLEIDIVDMSQRSVGSKSSASSNQKIQNSHEVSCGHAEWSVFLNPFLPTGQFLPPN